MNITNINRAKLNIAMWIDGDLINAELITSIVANIGRIINN